MTKKSSSDNFIKSNKSKINLISSFSNKYNNKKKTPKSFYKVQKKSQTHCHLCKKLISRKNYRVHLYFTHNAIPPKSLKDKKNKFHNSESSSSSSDDSDESKIEYKEISTGFIPKNFIIHHTKKNKVVNKNKNKFNDCVKKKYLEDNYSSSNIDSSSSGEEEQEQKSKMAFSNFYMGPDSYRIEKEVDEIIKIMKNKRKISK